MMNNFNFYYLWSDPMFYAFAVLFFGGLAGAVYSIRRYLELKNADSFDDEGPLAAEETPAPQELFPAEELPAEDPAASMPAEPEGPVPVELPAEAGVTAAADATIRVDPPAFAESPAAEPQPQSSTRAEQFLKGLYEAVGNLDRRMAGLEQEISKTRINSDFTVKFLEDLVADIDSIDKEKIKARLEYLVGDLKK